MCCQIAQAQISVQTHQLRIPDIVQRPYLLHDFSGHLAIKIEDNDRSTTGLLSAQAHSRDVYAMPSQESALSAYNTGSILISRLSPRLREW